MLNYFSQSVFNTFRSVHKSTFLQSGLDALGILVGVGSVIAMVSIGQGASGAPPFQEN